MNGKETELCCFWRPVKTRIAPSIVRYSIWHVTQVVSLCEYDHTAALAAHNTCCCFCVFWPSIARSFSLTKSNKSSVRWLLGGISGEKSHDIKQLRHLCILKKYKHQSESKSISFHPSHFFELHGFASFLKSSSVFVYFMCISSFCWKPRHKLPGTQFCLFCSSPTILAKGDCKTGSCLTLPSGTPGIFAGDNLMKITLCSSLLDRWWSPTSTMLEDFILLYCLCMSFYFAETTHFPCPTLCFRRFEVFRLSAYKQKKTQQSLSRMSYMSDCIPILTILISIGFYRIFSIFQEGLIWLNQIEALKTCRFQSTHFQQPKVVMAANLFSPGRTVSGIHICDANTV